MIVETVARDAPTTAVLMQRIRAGDLAARASLIARIQPLLKQFAHSRLPPHLRRTEETADLLQRTWLRVLDKLPTLEPREPGAMFAYLRVALINDLRDALRQHQRSPDVTENGEVAVMLTPDDSVSAQDLVEYERCLERLPEALRHLVLMRFEFGMSFSEIARELGEREDAVRMRLKRALKQLTET